jgi:hypothetical protein
VSGVMHGLVDNLNGQAPTSIVFTSDVSGLGITNTTATSTFVAGGIDISGGVVQSTTGILFNFIDSSAGGMQFRLNYSSTEARNALHWNGGSVAHAGMGNSDGFGGAQLSTLNGTLGSPVPEPSSIVLLGIGGFALAGYGWRRKKQAA